MAFRTGSAGLTSVNHEGKISNMNQWAGTPVRLGLVDSENVNFDFNNDASPNYRLQFTPRTGVQFSGMIASRSFGMSTVDFFKDFLTSSGSKWSTSGDAGFSYAHARLRNGGTITRNSNSYITVEPFQLYRIYAYVQEAPTNNGDAYIKVDDIHGANQLLELKTIYKSDVESNNRIIQMNFVTPAASQGDINITLGNSSSQYLSVKWISVERASAANTNRFGQNIFPSAYLISADSGDNLSNIGSALNTSYNATASPLRKRSFLFDEVEEGWEPHSRVTSVAADGDYYAVVTTKDMSQSIDTSLRFYDSNYVHVFDKNQNKVVKIESPEANVHLRSGFGYRGPGVPKQMDLSGSRIAIANYRYHDRGYGLRAYFNRSSEPWVYGDPVDQFSGRIYIYDIETQSFTKTIDAPWNGPNKYVDSGQYEYSPPGIFGSTDSSGSFGQGGISLDSNILAVSSPDLLSVHNIDSSNPRKPIFHVHDTERQFGGPVHVNRGYIAWGTHANNDEGRINVYDSVGNEVFSYVNPYGGTDHKLGYNVHLAAESDAPSGYLFAYAHGNNTLWRFRWHYDNFTLQTNTMGPTNGDGEAYGYSMASDPKKDILLIGAPGDRGIVYAYNYKDGAITSTSTRNETLIFDPDSDDLYSKTDGFWSGSGTPTEPQGFGYTVDISENTTERTSITGDLNKIKFNKPKGLADNIGQSGSILITKNINYDLGVDSEGYFVADSCWWFPGGAEVDSAKRINALTPTLGAKHSIRDMINYYVFDSDKIFCSWQKDLR